MGPATVIITSAELAPPPPPEGGSPDGGSGGDEEWLTVVASTREPQQPGFPQRFVLRIPKRPLHFTGTGALRRSRARCARGSTSM